MNSTAWPLVLLMPLPNITALVLVASLSVTICGSLITMPMSPPSSRSSHSTLAAAKLEGDVTSRPKMPLPPRPSAPTR